MNLHDNEGQDIEVQYIPMTFWAATCVCITLRSACRHVMNLGHGVLPGTPEENVATYFEVARTAHQRW
jgi:hypothetical protein